MPPRDTTTTIPYMLTQELYTTTAAPTLNTIAWNAATNAATTWNQTYTAINDVTTNFRRHTASADDFRDAVNGWFNWPNNATATMVYQVDPVTDTVRIYPNPPLSCEDSCEDWNTPELDSFIDSFAKNKGEWRSC